MTDEQTTSPGGTNPESGAGASSPNTGHYTFSPVTVEATDTSGVIFLGLLAILLLVALLRALAQNRKLENELAGRSPK